MSQNQEKLVTIFGGSGFVGGNIVKYLANEGYRIRIASRRPELSIHLQTSGSVNQISFTQANIRYKESISKAIQGSDIVINLCGVLFEHSKQNYNEIHVQGAENIAKAAKAEGVAQLIHFSAINSTEEASATYSRTKAMGEKAVKINFSKAVIIRPSVIFGKQDNFFNQFADIARFLPALPLIGHGKSKLQPVYVGDIAKAVCKIIKNNIQNKIYEFGGPEIISLREVFEFVLEETGRKRLLVPLPFSIAKIWAWCFEIIPFVNVITKDQVRMLEEDNIVTKKAFDEGRSLEGLGITPSSISAIVPSYLVTYRKKGQFNHNFRHSEL